MLLTIQCTIEGSAGFRCVSKIFNVIHNTLSLPSFPTPVFSTIRDWLLKFGLFNLTKPCEKGKWVWIIDFSIQMGAMRCLLILGVRMEALEARGNFTLSHSDVEPIILKTLKSCRGEVVKAVLDEAKERTGEVVAIVSDQGGELKRGIRLFQEEQTEKPVHLYDIIHKVDLVLKKELENDIEWQKFIKEMTNTTQQLKQSTSSHLIPPKQYQKKRRMRSEVDIIEWGMKILKYLDSGKSNKLENEKLSWVIKYRQHLIIYQEMAFFFDMSTKEVREHGYCQKTLNALKEKRSLTSCSERGLCFFSKILEIIEQEVRKVTQGSLLGCSEVIESVFGKFKQLEKQHASAGLTSLVLGLPALLGKMSTDILKSAMEQISIGKVKEWVKTNLGETYWSRRRSDLKKEFYVEDDYLELDDFIARVAS